MLKIKSLPNLISESKIVRTLVKQSVKNPEVIGEIQKKNLSLPPHKNPNAEVA